MKDTRGVAFLSQNAVDVQTPCSWKDARSAFSWYYQPLTIVHPSVCYMLTELITLGDQLNHRMFMSHFQQFFCFNNFTAGSWPSVFPSKVRFRFWKQRTIVSGTPCLHSLCRCSVLWAKFGSCKFLQMPQNYVEVYFFLIICLFSSWATCILYWIKKKDYKQWIFIIGLN